jgi:GT2 family glycosyltransferase/glycosyltransferase involved in cell wall biosynthesis
MKRVPQLIGKAAAHARTHGLRATLAVTVERLAEKWPTRRGRASPSASLPAGSVPPAPRIAFLTYRLKRGYGVDVVVAEQLEYFLARGYQVLCVVLERDDSYLARFAPHLRSGRLRVVTVRSVEEAAREVEDGRASIAIACTPPLFSVLPILGKGIVRVFYDYGEPPAHLFPDREAREAVEAERRRCASAADLVIAISDYVRATSNLPGAMVIDLGNDHQLRGRSNLAELAGTFAHRAALRHRFIVLNVTRYEEAERRYKGVDLYVEVERAFLARHPQLAGRVTFALAGRSSESDRRWAADQGLHALSNLDDDELVAAYLDASFYLTTSQWEGYNLGLAQALALGIDAAASDRGAHRQFGIPVSNDPAVLADVIARAVEGTPQQEVPHTWRARLPAARLYPWRDSCRALEERLVSVSNGSTSAVPVSEQLGFQLRRRSLPRPGSAAKPEISFLVLNRDRPDLLLPCLAAIERECQVPFEVLIGDTGSTDATVQAFYANTRHSVRHLGFYQFSAGNNVLAAQALGRVLCLINNDVELIRADFAEAASVVHDSAVGTVGAMLIYPDFRIQHAGMRICPHPPYQGIPEHFDRFQPIDGHPGLSRPRDVVSVTGAFLMILGERYRELGGLDEAFQEEAQDVDLGLKLFAQGLRNVVHPALLAFHRENSTRTVLENPADRDLLTSRYGELISERIYPWQAERGL